ncbi:MAG TPA: PfkB family carbohydrate kinase, partial [Marmoricola sp.]
LDSIADVDTSRVRRIDRTGSYLAVIDTSGELVIGVADMSATEALTPGDIGSAAGFDWVCADGNLLPDTLAAVVDAARDADVPAVLDPVGVAKARRLGTLETLPVHTFTPNRDELAAFAGTDGLLTAVGRAHDRGVEWLWLREGPSGSRLYGPDGKVRHIPAYRGEVVDVTGAGDAMLAGYLHALGQGADPAAAAEYGAAAAALTIASPQPVRPDLDAALLTRTVTPARERGHS